MNIDPKEQQTHPIEPDNQVSSKDGQNIENEKDIHEMESGNVGEADAEKDKLSGPSVDLVACPVKMKKNSSLIFAANGKEAKYSGR